VETRSAAQDIQTFVVELDRCPKVCQLVDWYVNLVEVDVTAQRDGLETRSDRKAFKGFHTEIRLKGHRYQKKQVIFGVLQKWQVVRWNVEIDVHLSENSRVSSEFGSSVDVTMDRPFQPLPE
jgi:hypothetical protein